MTQTATTSAGSGEKRICSRTGLQIVPSVGQTVYRIGETEWGPMNPLKRPRSDDRGSWSRWDVPGHRTLYAASEETAAFSEVISYIRPGLPATPMDELFDDVGDDDAETLDAQIAAELPRHGSMLIPSISKGWRQARSIYTLSLPWQGWFVDVTAAQSISTIQAELRDTLGKLGVSELTLGVITGNLDKMITTTIAEWIRSVVLDDGSLPHGIVYRSKWGADWPAWAIWLRRVDDGLDPASEQLTSISQDDIGVHTKTLVDAARLRNMRIY
ncbi:RES domain-containing protein [Rhodococcus sp. USK13]|uniref:RES domain-containing protein n=1 Tax=Rhodococcus sp. USK13 TaxID=2806442 RepID=UPI00201661F9|nr:RES domain-containing protein [Rhodococcus sp. USK13]